MEQSRRKKEGDTNEGKRPACLHWGGFDGWDCTGEGGAEIEDFDGAVEHCALQDLEAGGIGEEEASVGF